MNAELKLPASIQTIPDALAFWDGQNPDAPALIVPGSPVITYAELWRRVRELADALGHAGIAPHDRVLLLVPDGPALAIALLGTMTAALAIPLADTVTASELARALHGLHAAAAITTATVSAEVRAFLAQRGIAQLELRAGAVAEALSLAGHPMRSSRRGASPRADDVAFAIQTSGTTGLPKRVPRTHRGILAAAKSHRDLFGLSPRDRALSVAPMTLALGLTTLVYAIVAGSSLVFPASLQLAPLWQTIAVERPTWMFPPAGLLELLARSLRRRPDLLPPSSLRFVRVTAGPISPEVCAELSGRFGAPVLPSYSSSEAGLIAAALPPPARHKPGSAGRPLQELRVVDEAGNDVPSGEAGEIWLRVPRIFPGYLDDPARNASAFSAGGWFHTGDVGHLDGDGFLFLTGRRSDIINRGGEKIAPEEIDAVVRRHPAVADAAAFAVPDARLGEDIVAAVVPKPDVPATARELRDWMLDRLAPRKVPRRIWFVDQLPRTPSGKVQRSELARRWRG